MTDEGYIQNKIRGLKEDIDKSENKIKNMMLLLDEKEKKINELIKALSPKIKNAQEAKERLAKIHNMAEDALNETKLFHKKEYSRMNKKIQQNLNFQLEQLLKKLNYTIVDHTTTGFVLSKLLLEKGIITGKELLKYVDKNHDEIRDSNLLNPPQKSIKILFED